MIVCIEGINGSGKTTTCNPLLALWTHGRAQLVDPVQHTSFGTTVRIAIMAAGALPADAETLAFASARLHTASTLTYPSPNELIVLERWAGAVIAYGTVAGASPFLLRALESSLAGALPVDLTILLDVPGTVAATRLAALADQNRFETQGAGYLEKVRRQYRAWASIRHVPIINGLLNPAAIASQIADLVEAEVITTTTKESA
jgi:thymidylate kinase